MQEAPEKTRDRPKVVVIGAGFAGVGAARHLIQGGLRDVTLVEAGERPGGRVQTVSLDGGFVELGAQFLHGESELFHFAQRHGLLRDEEDEEDPVPDTVLVYQDYTFRMPDGSAVKTRDVVHNLQVLEELIERQINGCKAGEEGSSDVTVSVGQFLQRLYPEYQARMAGDQRVKAAMTKWLELWTVIDSAATVQDLSLAGVARYEYEQGSGVLETNTGFWEVLRGLLQDVLPDCRLLLGKPVKRVLWKNSTAGRLTSINNNNVQVSTDMELEAPQEKCPEDPKSRSSLADESEAHPRTGRWSCDSGSGVDLRVRVECEDGEVLVADHVIVTPSIGVLKERLDFFVPPLPAAQREAIDRLGFGNVAKVFLLWEEEEEETGHSHSPHSRGGSCCCWRSRTNFLQEWQRRMFGNDVEGMALLWPEDQHVEITSARSSLRTSEGRQWYEDVCLMEYISSYGPCLVVWLGGEGSVIMESLPVPEVKDVLYELLTKFMGKTDLPPPSRLIRSEWHQNRFTRGAYSYLPTGVPLQCQDVLSHPLPSPQDPVLQLAGEACSARFYSTAHGALDSGQQAASILLRHYNLLH